VARKPDAELAASLDRLVRAGLLFRKGAPPHATYLFKHALVQDAAYGTLLRQARRDLHLRISTTLIDQFPDIADIQPEILANHCYEAGLVDKAIQWRIKAGQRALRRSAFKEAVRQFNSGLSCAGDAREQVDLRYVVELHTGLGMALTATNGYASKEAGEAFTRARVLCEKLNDTKALARAGYGQYLYHMMAGQVLKSEELAREILALGDRLASSDLRVLGLRTLGVSLSVLGHLAQAQDSLDQAMSLLVAQTGKDVTKAGEAPVMIWTWLCHVFLYQGHFDRSRMVSAHAGVLDWTRGGVVMRDARCGFLYTGPSAARTCQRAGPGPASKHRRDVRLSRRNAPGRSLRARRLQRSPEEVVRSHSTATAVLRVLEANGNLAIAYGPQVKIHY
jgi:hypothetical protein